MNIETQLKERSGHSCELCQSKSSLSVHEVEPCDGSAEQCLLICKQCEDFLGKSDADSVNHWRCLNDSMWSPIPAVQVTAYRQLKTIAAHGWPQTLIDTLYLEPDIQAWADSDNTLDELTPLVVDSNGSQLNAGDTVTIIKDLDVKGAGFTAKRGTSVKNINVGSDPSHIEGRVNGVRIMLKTCFLKKS